MRSVTGWSRARAWVVALFVVMTAACGGAEEQGRPEGPTPDTVAHSPAADEPPPEPGPQPSPTPTSATAQEYQQVLSELDAQLADGVKAVDRRRGPKGLPDAVADLATRVEQQRTALAGVVPPDAVAGAHVELQVALADLSTEVGVLRDTVAANGVCAGPNALRRLGNSAAAEAVRSASAALAQADPAERYTVGAFVPEPGEERERRGRNGDLRPGKRGGLGQMSITASPASDALIKLRRGDEGIRNVYVRAGSTVEIKELPDGTYQAYVAQGVDWNDATGRFTRECSFSRLDDSFDFTTTSTQYTIWTLELEETIFGNARSTEVDPDDFPE